MELATVGKNYYPGYQMLIWHNPREDLSPERGASSRFRLVLVENGAGIVRLGERRETFVAPAVFCLNEQERPELEQGLDLRARALYFHPNVVNSVFTFENMRGETHFSDTEEQDLYWLRPFLQRSPEYGGCLHVGPISHQRLVQLFDGVDQQLARQEDWSWTCRSRSFLLEALFLLERAFHAPQAHEEIELAKPERNVDPVILYLHTHYRERITIEELSRRFHTNRTTLTEQFREATGLPVISYLIQLRIRLAALMLRDTTLPVSEILARVGFRDDSHFGRLFRNHLGCSPSEYRRRYCWHLH